MNQPDARAVWTISGYAAEYRLAWKAEYHRVLIRNDQGKMVEARYRSEADAERHAWREKSVKENPPIIADREVALPTTAKQRKFKAAEKLLMGGGKTIPVERIETRA